MTSGQSRAFTAYVVLWLVELGVGIARKGVTVGWVLPLVVTVLLLIGLVRGLWIAWVLLLISAILGTAAPWILIPRGGHPATESLVIAALSLAQVVLLLSPWLSPWVRRRGARGRVA